VSEVEALDRRIVAVEADVRRLEKRLLMQTAVDEHRRAGRVDIVLANAGIGMVRDGLEPATAFREVLEINLVGVWNTVHAAAPAMIEQGRGGSIVLTGSVMG